MEEKHVKPAAGAALVLRVERAALSPGGVDMLSLKRWLDFDFDFDFNKFLINILINFNVLLLFLSSQKKYEGGIRYKESSNHTSHLIDHHGWHHFARCRATEHDRDCL